MIRLKNQPDATMKIQGKLAPPVPCQGMRAACDQLPDMGGRHQISEPAEELLRAGLAQLPMGGLLLFTEFAQPSVGKVQFQRYIPKETFTT